MKDQTQEMDMRFNASNEPLRDRVAERQIASVGATFDVDEVCVDQIKTNPGTANYTRTDGTCSETVDSYEAAYRSKAHMPMIVVISSGKHYTVIGGHHRLQAAQKAGLKKLWCYVLPKESEPLAIKLSGTLNSFHGRGLSLEQRLSMALSDVQTNGTSEKDAAMFYNVKHQRLLDYKKQKQVDTLLISHGIKTEKLQMKLKEQLSKLQDKSAAVETAKTIISGKMTNDEGGMLIEKVKEAGNKWVQVIAQQQSVPTPKKHGAIAKKRSDDVRLIQYLQMVRTLVSGKPTLQSIGFEEVKDEHINLVKEVSNALQRLSHI